MVYEHDDDDADSDSGDGSGDNAEFSVASSGDSRSTCTAVDLPWCHDHSRVKGPLGDNEERRRVRREGGNKPLGHTDGGSVGKADTRRASRDSAYKGCVSWI